MHTDRASPIRSVARDRPDGRTSVRIMTAPVWAVTSAQCGRCQSGRPGRRMRLAPPPGAVARLTAAATPPAASATPTGAIGGLGGARPQVTELLHQFDLECLLERGGAGGGSRGLGGAAASIGTIARIGMIATGRSASAPAVGATVAVTAITA